MKKIFLLGFPRSGTTWIANIFNSHPDVAYRHEFLGREYKQIDSQLFDDLKLYKKLKVNELKELDEIFLTPLVSTDRPPFFYKNHIKFSSPFFHYCMWSTCKFFPQLQVIYNYFYKPQKKHLSYLCIKETRSSTDLGNILRSIETDYIFTIFRNPKAVIASHLNGISTGKMQGWSEGKSLKWFDNNFNSKVLIRRGVDRNNILELSEIELYALNWCVYYENLLDFCTLKKIEVAFINYDELLNNSEQYISDIFTKLSLTYSSESSMFLNGKRRILNSKDSGSEFYSVFQKPDQEKWKSILNDEQIRSIIEITQETENKLIELSKLNNLKLVDDNQEID